MWGSAKDLHSYTLCHVDLCIKHNKSLKGVVEVCLGC